MRHDQQVLALFMAHRGKLVSYASGIVGNNAQAEDVVQEAYIRFNAAAVEDRILEEPVSYLYRIVHNLALDGRRRLAREARHILPALDRIFEEFPADQPSPETETVDRDEVRAMQAAIAELPERMKIALEMHRFGECTIKDIAEFLDISAGQAHSLVAKALDHCRQRLRRS